MKLSDFVVNQAITADLQADSRDEAIGEMVDSLVAAQAISADLRDDVIRSILAREKNGSTGFGKGVAVPHVKHEKIEKMAAAIGISPTGVDFNSLDKQPVYTIFMLLSPADKPDEHLHAMENIFANLQNDMFRKFMRQAETHQAVVDLLHEADTRQLSG